MTHDRVAVVQMTSSHQVANNLALAAVLIKQAAAEGAKLIVLPENFAMMNLEGAPRYHEPQGEGAVQHFLATMAKENAVWIVGGTVAIAAADQPGKSHAACLVFNDQGMQVARYDKVHLFDVQLPGRKERYFESEHMLPGNEAIVVPTPFGQLGLAVCYDLRFPEFFRALQRAGAEIIALPSAFTVPTGIAHWEVLIRARAIENQVYMVAAAQSGTHSNKRKTYGHSMIVGPWGEIKGLLLEKNGTVTAEIDLNQLYQLREEFPVLTHRRL